MTANAALRFALFAGCVVAVLFLLRPVAVARGQQTKPEPETTETVVKHPIDIALDKCMDKNSSTLGMSQCLTQAERAWDKEMNTHYRKLRSSLNADEQAKLVASQRAWLKYRDAEIKTQIAVYGRMQGTMYIPLSVDSQCELTRQRAKLLARYTELNEPK